MDRMAVVKAFAITSLPFVFAESITGIVSFLTGEPNIPPYLGAGTAIDLFILLAGLVAAVIMTFKSKRPDAEKLENP